MTDTPRRTYELRLAGELAGHRVVMGAMTGRDLIAIRTGEATEAQVIGIVAARIVEHDLGVEDPLDLDFWALTEILRAWGTAMEDAANPPATGER